MAAEDASERPVHYNSTLHPEQKQSHLEPLLIEGQGGSRKNGFGGTDVEVSPSSRDGSFALANFGSGAAG